MPAIEKVKAVEVTSERIEGVTGLYLADFNGMDVATISALRKKCREEGVQFKVVKNTLLKRAFAAKGVEGLDDFLVGPTGLVFSKENEVASARILADFAKEHQLPRIKAAVVDGRVYDDEAVKELAALPSREVLMSQVLSTLIAPLTQFLSLIETTIALPSNMIGALERKKNEESS